MAPKLRKIEAAPFRDRIVHQAIAEVIEPLLDPKFYHHSYACRSGRGTHRALQVLKGVSLSVPAGGIVAILGANGAGKTTTLRAVSNLLRCHY